MSQDMFYVGYLMDLKSVCTLLVLDELVYVDWILVAEGIFKFFYLLGRFLFSCSINYSERDTEVSNFIGKFAYFPFQLYQVFVFPSSHIFQLCGLVHTYSELLCPSW